jgi:hypothetical protein
MEGHEAFGAGRYDQARRFYQEARRRGSSSGWLPELIDLVERRAALGKVRPSAVHQAQVLFVTTRRTLDAGRVRVEPDVTPAQRAVVVTYLGVVRRILEAYSDGGWTLEWHLEDVAATLPAGLDRSPAHPDAIAAGFDFYETDPEVDTYVTVSNAVSPARGLARTYPYVAGVLYGPSRGMLEVHPQHHGYGVIFHEFFHVIEWASGGIGGPAHGFRADKRHHFPAWKGETELDYYRWHFAETLTPKGWRRLNLRTRFRRLRPAPKALGEIRRAYRRIPLRARYRAVELVDEAKAAGPKTARAGALYREAAALSPYEERALRPLVARARGRSDAESEALRARLRLARAVTETWEVGRDGVGGRAVGTWRPEDVVRAGSVMTWDVTPSVPGPGRYEVAFVYTHGWNALGIDWAELSGPAGRLARDAHRGFSGKRHEARRYLLEVQANPGSQVVLRARIRGEGGEDSHGLVFLRRLDG